MIAAADFDEAYNTKPCNMEPPVCKAPECFIASYPPVSPPGVPGNFNVNTSFLQPNSCLLYTSPSPRDKRQSRMPSSA